MAWARLGCKGGHKGSRSGRRRRAAVAHCAGDARRRHVYGAPDLARRILHMQTYRVCEMHCRHWFCSLCLAMSLVSPSQLLATHECHSPGEKSADSGFNACCHRSTYEHSCLLPAWNMHTGRLHSGCARACLHSVYSAVQRAQRRVLELHKRLRGGISRPLAPQQCGS